MEKYRKAKLNDRDNDLSKQWYVEYMYMHPEKEVMVPFRKYISLKIKTGTARRVKADQLINELNEWLTMGGNPFDSENLGNTNVITALKNILELKKQANRYRTYTSYKDSFVKFERFLTERRIHDLAVDDITSSIVQQFSDYMLLKLKIGNRTHNNMIANLKAMWKMMMKRFNIRINPWITIEMLEEEEPPIVMFSPAEMEAVSEKLCNDDFELWICACFVFYCALRPQEIVRLQMYNVDIERKVVIVDGRITKNKKSRLISIPNDSFIEDIKLMHLEKYDNKWHLFSTGLKPGANEIAPTRIAERWRAWADKNKVERCIYDLKHNAVGIALDHGINLRDLQLHLRHHDLSETQKYAERFRRDVGVGFKEKYPKL